MKAIKALVVLMAVLIVAGVGLVVYGVARNKGAAPVPSPAVATIQPVGPAVPLSGTLGGFYDVNLPLPDGARIEQIQPWGDLILLRTASAKGDVVLLVDPRTGQTLGRMAPPRAP